METIFSDIWIKNTAIFIRGNRFECVICKIAPVSGLNELKQYESSEGSRV